MIDHTRVSAIIREAAESEILPRFRRLQAHQVHEKRPGDLVTEADIEAEKLLARRLTALLPGSVVVGEEGVAADPRRMDALLGEAPVWIVDPVDGTSNFAHDRPMFGVIVALAQGGRTLAGWIHDPINDVTAVAEVGQGAWIGDRRLSVSAEMPLSAMAGSIGYRKNPRLQAVVGQLLRHGSAAHDYLALAEARMQFAFYHRLMPWDHAAGVLIHTEAGGYAALLNGSPYRPLPGGEGVLLTPGRDSWQVLARLLA